VPQALVTTKLRAPRTRPNLVRRPRLRQAFGQVQGRRLTLVSAPAGFGKTTLLAEWLDDRWGDQRSFAWVSLDETDNDPARILAYLVRALQTVEEGIGEGVVDEPPEKPGFKEFWGRGVYHCPYCHGWEVRDRPLAVLNSGNAVQSALFASATGANAAFFVNHSLVADEVAAAVGAAA
jgi:hypothetical protein